MILSYGLVVSPLPLDFFISCCGMVRHCLSSAVNLFSRRVLKDSILYIREIIKVISMAVCVHQLIEIVSGEEVLRWEYACFCV